LIYKSPANLNLMEHTRRHIRLLRPRHRAAVLEFGLLHGGDIRKHCRVIRPHIGIITNIGTAHIGHFRGSRYRLALAKSELIRNMKRKGWVFLNADCSYSGKFVRQPFRGAFAGTFVSVGINHPATYRAYNVQYEQNGMSFMCNIAGSPHHFFIPVHGHHNITNALLAIAVTHKLGFPVEDIQMGLRTYTQPHRRLMTVQCNSVTVIDDTYSANPNAMKAEIDVLSEIGKGTNVAVLGSMLELGRYRSEGHLLVGRYLSQKNVHYLVTYGAYAGKIAAGAIESGFPPEKVYPCTNREQMHGVLANLVKSNTTFLVKGSHKMKMNRTAAYLRQAASKLVKPIQQEDSFHIPTGAQPIQTSLTPEDPSGSVELGESPDDAR